jgi:hypothetical protein
VVSRRVVVSEKADTHTWPFRGTFAVIVPIRNQVWTACPLMVMSSCSHTFTFHYKLQGALNMHCDEVLTDFVSAHLPVQKLVLYNPRPSGLTDFCTYASMTLTVWDSESACTSITAASVLMSVAIASILKVFFRTKKERKVYNVKQRGGEAAGAEAEREAGQTQGELWEEAEALEGTWEVCPVLYVCTMAVHHPFQVRGFYL